ncbi:uncharacterized protein TRIADDRAFT_53974 [Trichoplax adhaerens]|uniref:PRKCA-binding protein n=1 Tax=Trichoplax adhaerens TaxID=10228 RepID=B3RMJ9_TRIAD|nr:hypothetical protein TRIADDRAFT_53974 [Trichoplax adhaerens]EDV27862.1 hypothetical protein TRIADDRAFT_53974 [Trichoplax adhaerens]|eukprot:XP_002109696.1 hypothetical protein TRIADDRAFT_53974 [Trichoplax adhaerens]
MADDGNRNVGIPGSVKLTKDAKNLIGISIGGGAPLCPCLYVVQVFDNTPAAKDATLSAGDEIVGVNNISVKGKTKVEVAKNIQAIKGEVTINYVKLQGDPKQGKTLDIVLKKVKHRIVENMSSSTADSLGLSRAILCNDTLVKRLEELQQNSSIYLGLIERARAMMKSTAKLIAAHKAFGEAFAAIGVKEPQANASLAFSRFGEAHRNLERFGTQLLRNIAPIVTDLMTYLSKAIPDTRLTIKKYADVKFEYLAYCLKVKEMDDEEYGYAAMHESLYRVETGNYEYRLVLRCRHDARVRFAKLRQDVMVKLELLDHKHVQDLCTQLRRLIGSLTEYHQDCIKEMEETDIFPIEIDLNRALQKTAPTTEVEAQ